MKKGDRVRVKENATELSVGVYYYPGAEGIILRPIHDESFEVKFDKGNYLKQDNDKWAIMERNLEKVEETKC